jgi:hypothetical protein
VGKFHAHNALEFHIASGGRKKPESLGYAYVWAIKVQQI